MNLVFDQTSLQAIAAAARSDYASAKPFPHTVLDNVVPSESLEQVLTDFPDVNSPVWKTYKTKHENKLETQGEAKLSAATMWLLYQFNSAPFLQFLETLTGIDGLLPDPYFHGGGLHQIPKGGKLGVHADFSRHSRLPLDRRLNVLIYLNKNWEEEFGGHLELWDTDMKNCVKRILPVFNRMVVFTVTDWAFHGHPEPLTCPDGTTRKSIALYYYTAGRPDGEVIEGKQGTMFMARPGESVRGGRSQLHAAAVSDASTTGVKRIAKLLLPPIVVEGLKRLKGNGH